MPMRRCSLWLLLSIVCAFFLQKTGAQASAEKIAIGTEVYPRGFPGDLEVRYRWAAGKLILDPERLFTLGVLKVESVEVQRSQGTITGLKIQGKRRTLIQRKTGIVPSTATTQVTLTANLEGVPEDLLSNPEKLLFYPDQDAMMAALPPDFPKNPPLDAAGHVTEHSINVNGEWRTIRDEKSGADHVEQPKVISAPELEFSDEARQRKIGGTVLLGFTVDSLGKPTNIWLLSPTGSGLDEQARNSAMRYHFSPARYQGQSVGILMKIEVKFRIFP